MFTRIYLMYDAMNLEFAPESMKIHFRYAGLAIKKNWNAFIHAGYNIQKTIL